MPPATQDEELEYRRRFFQQLHLRSSIADAQAFALNQPQPGLPGRDLHKRLLTFLAAFEGCPRGRFTVNHARTLVPPGSSPQECQAYVELLHRLAGSGEIPADDCRFAERQLTPFVE